MGKASLGIELAWKIILIGAVMYDNFIRGFISESIYVEFLV